MKFEIDPNELTTDQRTHVAAFITGWPTYSEVANRLKEILDAPETEEFKMAKRAGGIAGARNLTEEQRLDVEQKSDLNEQVLGHAQGMEFYVSPEANLNAIFGTPTATERLELDAKIDSLVPLDSQGLPWDSRIHASTKTFIADGSWKLRRGVDSTEVEKVKAQLKELMAVPAFYSQGVVSPDKVPFAPVLSESGAETPVVTIGSASTVPVPPAPKSHYLIDQAPATLTDLIGRMSAAIVENRLTQANVTEICVKHGVSEFHLLSNRPDLLPLIDADMKAMGV